MEGSPKQEPLESASTLKKATPDPNTDFGEETLDESAMPQKWISAGGINEIIFGLMRPKKKDSSKVSVGSENQSTSISARHLYKNAPERNPIDNHIINPDYGMQNGLHLQKKNLAERVRDQIKFPVLKSSQSMVNGAALVVFAVGAYILYSELPTRPELVIGIILISIAGNIIISNR